MSRKDGYLVPGTVDPSVIIREVARGFLITPADILSRSQEPRMCVARACAMAVVREYTGMSFPAIGRLFDRDHTTVMGHVRKITADPELSEQVRMVVEELDHAQNRPRLFAVESVG